MLAVVVMMKPDERKCVKSLIILLGNIFNLMHDEIESFLQKAHEIDPIKNSLCAFILEQNFIHSSYLLCCLSRPERGYAEQVSLNSSFRGYNFSKQAYLVLVRRLSDHRNFVLLEPSPPGDLHSHGLYLDVLMNCKYLNERLKFG